VGRHPGQLVAESDGGAGELAADVHTAGSIAKYQPYTPYLAFPLKDLLRGGLS